MRKYIIDDDRDELFILEEGMSLEEEDRFYDDLERSKELKEALE